MHIFLDLEETVIESWYNPIFLAAKIKHIRQQIALAKQMYGDIKSLNIFSFAIIDDNDLNEFNRSLREDIERIFQIPISDVFIFSEENAFELAKKAGIMVLKTDKISDVFLRNQKEEIFDLYTQHKYVGEINILFDDMVSNTIKEYHKTSPLSNEQSTKVITIKV